MSKINRITMSILGTDAEGKEKHIAVDISNPDACAKVAGAKSQGLLTVLGTFAGGLLETHDDAHKLIVDEKNAKEELAD